MAGLWGCLMGLRLVIGLSGLVASQLGKGGVTGFAQIVSQAVRSDAQQVSSNFQGETENGFDEHELFLGWLIGEPRGVVSYISYTNGGW